MRAELLITECLAKPHSNQVEFGCGFAMRNVLCSTAHVSDGGSSARDTPAPAERDPWGRPGVARPLENRRTELLKRPSIVYRLMDRHTLIPGYPGTSAFSRASDVAPQYDGSLAGSETGEPTARERRVAVPAIARPVEPRTSRVPGIVRSLVLAGAWVLFAYWWSVVLRREGADSLVAVARTLASGVLVISLAAVIWVQHNLRIARAGKRGRASLYRPLHFSQDFLGRPLEMPPPAELDRSAHVIVDIVDGLKRYRAVADMENR